MADIVRLHNAAKNLAIEDQWQCTFCCATPPANDTYEKVHRTHCPVPEFLAALKAAAPGETKEEPNHGA